MAPAEVLSGREAPGQVAREINPGGQCTPCWALPAGGHTPGSPALEAEGPDRVG
jgi:hypothetical protein